MINTLIKYEQVLPGGVRVILTVTLNPAGDVTYLVDRLVPRSPIRVASARQRAHGKGANVARVAEVPRAAGAPRDIPPNCARSGRR